MTIIIAGNSAFVIRTSILSQIDCTAAPPVAIAHRFCPVLHQLLGRAADGVVRSDRADRDEDFGDVAFIVMDFDGRFCLKARQA